MHLVEHDHRKMVPHADKVGGGNAPAEASYTPAIIEGDLTSVGLWYKGSMSSKTIRPRRFPSTSTLHQAVERYEGAEWTAKNRLVQCDDGFYRPDTDLRDEMQESILNMGASSQYEPVSTKRQQEESDELERAANRLLGVPHPQRRRHDDTEAERYHRQDNRQERSAPWGLAPETTPSQRSEWEAQARKYDTDRLRERRESFRMAMKVSPIIRNRISQAKWLALRDSGFFQSTKRMSAYMRKLR